MDIERINDTAVENLLYWNVSTAQTGLTGDKTGTFNLTTTGTLSALSGTFSSLTSGCIPYASTAGLLIDSANLTYNGTTFSIGTAAGTGANKFFIRGSSYPVSKTERYYADGYNSTLNVGIFSAYSGRDTTSGWGPVMTFISNDNTASECGLGQLGFVRDTATPTYRGKFIVYLSGTGGSYSEAFTIGHTGIITITPREADYDTIINFIGTTNSGVLSWMEDEDYFQFSDDAMFLDNESMGFGTGAGTPNVADSKIYFNASGLIIQSDVVTATDYLQLRGGTNGIDFNIGATEQISLIDGILQPTTTNDIDLGTSALLYKDIWEVGKHYFRDSALYINSNDDGHLDLTADTNIDMNGAVAMNNLITLYNNVATEDYGVPAIVDGVALTNQNTSIGATNFTNAGVAGLYEVDWYLECTTADISAGVVTATIGWTDDTATAASASSAALALTSKGRNWTRCYCQLASGNITYSTTVGGGAGTSRYALYATCKRLK